MILNRFIVLEGIDGSGTSTQLKKLSDFFTANSIDHHLCCEPTDNSIGMLIRQILKGEMKVTTETLALLFAADRNEHVYGRNGIIENHQAGKWIICDRYLFSTLAYQRTGMKIEKLYQLNKDFPLPEITFFVNTPAESADQRVSARNETREIYETLQLQKNIVNNYFSAFELFEKTGMKLSVIDGEQTIATVTSKIIDELKKLPDFKITNQKV